MSKPFLIWTMRRTGGTSLSSLIQRYASFPVLHEPFNTGRPWNDLAVGYKAREKSGESTAAIEQSLTERLSDSKIVKNCYDIHRPGLHLALMRIASSLGYQHLILDRHNEQDRILSLALAAQTGAWGKSSAETIYPEIFEGRRKLSALNTKKVVNDRQKARERRLWLHGVMQAEGIRPVVVFFEDIYDKGADGEKCVCDLFDALGIPREPKEKFEQDLHTTVHKRSQGSARLLPLLPNIGEVRDALSEDSEWLNPFAQIR